MGAFDAARCGAALAAIATAGCAEVFGIEPPPALSNAGGPTVYDGVAHPPLNPPAWPVTPYVREVRGPAVIVLQVPAGTFVTVTTSQDPPPAPAPRLYRPSPYEDDPAPTPPPYKPSPYEDPRPATLYRSD